MEGVGGGWVGGDGRGGEGGGGGERGGGGGRGRGGGGREGEGGGGGGGIITTVTNCSQLQQSDQQHLPLGATTHTHP